MKNLTFLLVLALALPVFASGNGGPKAKGKPLAHVVSLSSSITGIAPPRHVGNAVTFVYNQDVGNATLLPNVENGSTMIQAACSTAAQQWENVSGIDFTDGGTVVTSDTNGGDGVNLVTFVQSSTNDTAVGSALAVALVSFNTPSGDITDADIVFSNTMMDRFSTGGGATFIDIGSVATHEFGHTFGLNHSPIASATMFPLVSNGATHPQTLTVDDIAGINAVYEDIQHFWSTGKISGTVTQTGSGTVYGAHVVARSVVDGVTRSSTISNPDGTYTIFGLPTGPYIVYAEPLDEPVIDTNIITSHYVSGKNTTFRTTFLGGIATPTVIRVEEALTTSGIDITIAAGTQTPNVRFNKDVPGGGFPSAVNRDGFEKAPGDVTTVFLAGPDAAMEADGSYSIAGHGIAIVGANTDGGTTVGSDTAKQFPVTVAADAEPGPRDLVMDNGIDITVYSGLIDVTPAGSPMATTYKYGTGSAGSAGTPDLEGVGTPTIPAPGFTLRVTNAPAGQTAFFFGALRPDYIDFSGTVGPGVIQWLRIPQADLFPSGGQFGSGLQSAVAAGEATLGFPIPNIPNIDGLRIYVQTAISDSVPGGITTSNALVLRLQL